MKVLLDCTQITVKKAGVGVYALNLVRGLCRSHGRKFDLFLLVQDDDGDFQIEGRNVQILRVASRLFRFLPFRLLMEQTYIPWLIRKYKIDIVHSLHYSFALLPSRAKRIVTIHDMTSFLMPEVHLKSKVLYFRFFITAASYLADAQIYVSNSTREDWKKRFPRSSVSCYTVPLGKADRFRPDLDQASIAAVRKKYALTDPYILYIGTIEPRKNLTRLVSAFGEIAEQFPSHRLVITGMKGWGYEELFQTIKQLHLESRVVFTGFAEEEDKAQLLAGAEIFVYPSLYEGFGIPVLEAMACGIPTVTSAISSLPEVAGDGALLVNPADTSDIRDKMEQLLRSADLRSAMKARALKQAAKFTWERTVSETINVYGAVGFSLGTAPEVDQGAQSGENAGPNLSIASHAPGKTD